MKERVPIPYEQFRRVAISCCRTLSRTARPAIEEAAYTYDCLFGELVAGHIYPVWFVDVAQTRFLGWNDPEARPIRVAELASRMTLIEDMLSRWFKPELGPIKEASFVTLHCTGCNRRVVIDGVHRALWLAAYGDTSTPVHVTELAGRQWPLGTPDLSVICACRL